LGEVFGGTVGSVSARVKLVLGEADNWVWKAGDVNLL